MFSLSFATLVSIGTTVLGFVSKLWGGGSGASTAGDQKAVDEAAAVRGAATIIKSQAEASGDDVTKKDLDDGKF